MSDHDKDDSKAEVWLPVGEAARQIMRHISQDGVVNPAKMEAAIAAAIEAGHDPFRSSLKSKGAAIRFPVEPRDIPPYKAARRLHLTLAEFVVISDNLYARGFPRPDPTTGMYDLVAIDAWMDRRSDLTSTSPLTPQKQPRNSQETFGDRARRLANGSR